MKKDQMIPGLSGSPRIPGPPARRAVLRIAACTGIALTARLFLADRAQTPGRPAPPAGAEPAAGPPAGALPRTPGHRLSPMTGGAQPEFRRAAPPVRDRPLLELPELGHSMVLTFDDGPDPAYTPAILRTLREHDVRAVFFVCGEMADDHRDLLREIADDGHVIGNHSWSHPLMTKLTRSAIRAEMGRTSEVVERAVGAPPLWYRAPYGAWNRHSFEVGAELGMEPLAWTVDSLDWMTPGTGLIVRRVLDGAGPGVIILSHDAGGDRSQSVAALRRYLPGLLDAGYRIAVPHR
ncbi:MULTISPECIES: polysaccharide deacetylase family protein [unclassified Streptomyces]|uniref:polysaccharide deacetylase family protein n=1 Tax=unclassified Streptomyces TaxID=2593676 RepID=UPI0037FA4FE4